MPKISVIKTAIAEYASNHSPIFTIDTIMKLHPELHIDSVTTTLCRFCNEGSIVTPWKGVYIFSPQTYYGSNDVHLREYIDVIMSKIGIQYYVSMLDALHELLPSYCKVSTNEYQVMIENSGMSGNLGKTSPKPFFLRNKRHPAPYINSKETKYGKLNLPTAELLAVDLVAYNHAIRGLQASVEALRVLSPKLNFRRLKEDIFEYRTAANIQRLGYIIENTLGLPAKAQPLHDLLDKRYNKVYARNSLASDLPPRHNIDKRWQLDVNTELKG